LRLPSTNQGVTQHVSVQRSHFPASVSSLARSDVCALLGDVVGRAPEIEQSTFVSSLLPKLCG
jgi:hypothetical protein